jgi:hypothetical protein
MGYTRTMPAPLEDASRKPSSASALTEGGKAAFFFMLLFTAQVYGRPGDILKFMAHWPTAQVLAVLAMLSYIAARMMGQVKFRISPELKIVTALTIIFVAGVPVAFWRSRSYETLTDTWLKTVIVFFLMTQLLTSIERMRKLLWVLFGCMAVVSGYSVAARAGAVLDQGYRMIGANMGMLSGNYLGITVATMLPFMAVMLMRARTPIPVLFLLGSFAVVMWMVVLTASRASMLTVTASLVLVWVLILKENAKSRIVGTVLLVAVALTVASAPQLFWDRVVTLWEDRGQATSTATASAIASEHQRKVLLMKSLEATMYNPLLGLGIGNFPIYSGSSTHNAQLWKGTHNSFTEVSSEAGIIALGLFLGLIFTVISSMRKIAKEYQVEGAEREYRYFALATLVSMFAFMFSAFFAHLAYDYHLYYLAAMGVALRTGIERNKQIQAMAGGSPLDAAAKQATPRLNGYRRSNGSKREQPAPADPGGARLAAGVRRRRW